MNEAAALTNAVQALQRGDTAAAIAAVDACIARDPDLGVAHLVRGRALLSAGDFNAAIEALERAVRIDPESAEAAATLGDALRALDAWRKPWRFRIALSRCHRARPRFACARRTPISTAAI